MPGNADLLIGKMFGVRVRFARLFAGDADQEIGVPGGGRSQLREFMPEGEV